MVGGIAYIGLHRAFSRANVIMGLGEGGRLRIGKEVWFRDGSDMVSGFAPSTVLESQPLSFFWCWRDSIQMLFAFKRLGWLENLMLLMWLATVGMSIEGLLAKEVVLPFLSVRVLMLSLTRVVNLLRSSLFLDLMGPKEHCVMFICLPLAVLPVASLVRRPSALRWSRPLVVCLMTFLAFLLGTSMQGLALGSLSLILGYRPLGPPLILWFALGGLGCWTCAPHLIWCCLMECRLVPPLCLQLLPATDTMESLLWTICVAEVSLLAFVFHGMLCATCLITLFYALSCLALKALPMICLGLVVVVLHLRVEPLIWMIRRVYVTPNLGFGLPGLLWVLRRLRSFPPSAGLLTLLRTLSSPSFRTLSLMNL